MGWLNTVGGYVIAISVPLPLSVDHRPIGSFAKGLPKPITVTGVVHPSIGSTHKPFTFSPSSGSISTEDIYMLQALHMDLRTHNLFVGQLHVRRL